MSLKPLSHGSGGRGAHEPDRLAGLPVLVDDERLPVDDLEGDLVDVHGVGVGGEVVDLPDLGGADAGFSVTGSSHMRGRRLPSRSTVPSSRPRPGRRPRRQQSSRLTPDFSISASGRRDRRRAGAAVIGRQDEELRRGASGPVPTAGTTRNCRTCPVVSRVGRRRSPRRVSPPPNGSSGPTLRRTWLPTGHVGEVDDDVGPLRQAHQQPVAVVGGEVDRRGEEAALVADLPDLDPGMLLKSRIRKRDWQPLRKRRRYRRCSTSGTARCCR